MTATADNHAIFPRGDKVPSDHFTGIAYLQMLVPDNDIYHCTIGNVVFEPGCRNNWHSHPAGQILICIDGEGYYQEKGKPIQLLSRGDVVQIQPNLVHWHGATPDRGFTHIAVGPNSQKGVVNWLGPVTDEEYNSYQ